MDLTLMGWDEAFSSAFANSCSGMTAGRVILQYNHIYTIATEAGEINAQVSGRLRHEIVSDGDLPVVGDWVALRLSSGNGTALIQSVLPRRSKFSRKASGRELREQVVAANIDIVFLLVGLDNDFSPRRVERYLAAAWESGAAPVVVLNKVDLCADVVTRVAAIRKVAPGVPVHAISALRGGGLESLAAYCAPGRTVALLGSSGVGKSTLINALLGTARMPTAAVREHDSRGRHTTTRRELVLMPDSGAGGMGPGGMLIDTPGMRELQLWEADEGVQATFDEIETLARECHFRDCRHQNEPGCAVRMAVEAGELAPDRLTGLHKLQKELAWLDRQRDQPAALEEKRRWKAIHKSAKRYFRETNRE
jgi:ribosome biogenesis GTPase / thiamine phosphate phosphatase